MNFINLSTIRVHCCHTLNCNTNIVVTARNVSAQKKNQYYGYLRIYLQHAYLIVKLFNSSIITQHPAEICVKTVINNQYCALQNSIQDIQNVFSRIQVHSMLRKELDSLKVKHKDMIAELKTYKDKVCFIF